MNKDPRAATRVRRLNRRQRKKSRVGEFQESIFDVELVFHVPMAEEQHDEFIDAFFDFMERRGLMGAGFGGRLPVLETDGVIARIGRGSPTEDDREAVVAWLRARPEVVAARALALQDAWHGDD